MARPRGFMDAWRPSIKVPVNEDGYPKYTHSPSEIVDLVCDIIDANQQILPLTLRQIFYMLLGYGFEKTDRNYKRLCETMNKARRARVVDMESIRDDDFDEVGCGRWGDEQALVGIFRANAEYALFDRQQGQEQHLMIWCEARGMIPQLADAARAYSVRVCSSGGFDSLTTKHDMAVKIAQYGAVEILHIGDHDPSGVHICSSLDEDLQAFIDHYGGRLTVTRLAVTPEQIKEMKLPTAPPKGTDNRKFEGRTTQAEAIPPRRLREIVVAAIEERIDFDIYNEVVAVEESIREDILERLDDL